MSIQLYDEAVSEKINSWLPKDNSRSIKILKPEESKRLFEIESDETSDHPISLPLLSLSRESTVEIRHPTMQPMSFDGLMLKSDGNKTVQLNAIPISLSYQLDIYTKRQDEGEELLRELLFKLINNPRITIEIPYNNQQLKHISSLTLQGEAEDTSDIQQRIFSGQFTRWTLRFKVNDAYLFSVPIVHNVKVEPELEVADNSDGKIYSKE